MEQATQKDFTGQEIFIGLDVSLKSWVASIMTRDLEHKTFTQPPDAAALMGYLKRTFPGARYRAVYEAGYCGYWISEALRSHGVDCIVVNPGDIPSTGRESRTKTDRVDARKLARSLRNGDLRPLYIPPREALEDRSLVRLRTTTVRKQTRCKNNIKSLLSFHGVSMPEGKACWSERYLATLSQLSLSTGSGTQSLRHLLSELRYYRSSVREITLEINSLARSDRYRKSVDVLKSIPGIGVLTAMILLTELGPLSRFPSEDRLASYCGLSPGEHSSGNRRIVTGITRRCNMFVRTALIEAAWIAARKDPELLRDFAIYAQRMKKQKAIVRIARRLLHRIACVLREQRPYVIRKVQSTRDAAALCLQ